jgi:hypothetical protein
MVNTTPRPPLPRKDPVPKGAMWASEPVWKGCENLAPPGFDPRTLQTVASHYTDYAIPGSEPFTYRESSSWSENHLSLSLSSKYWYRYHFVRHLAPNWSHGCVVCVWRQKRWCYVLKHGAPSTLAQPVPVTSYATSKCRRPSDQASSFTLLLRYTIHTVCHTSGRALQQTPYTMA